MTYHTIDDIKRANRNLGHHWFEPDTMRFFHSRIAPGVYGGRYFISSEQQENYLDDPYAHFPRRYTIRVANPDGSIDTVGEFQAYETLRAARKAVERLVAGYDETGNIPSSECERPASDYYERLES